MQTAKLFNNGRSQAVRLPAAFRFDTDEVYIYRDENTGNVILSKRPNDWQGFLDAVKDLQGEQLEFDRDTRMQHRDPFEDWSE
ncbi:antitoxin [Glaesserella sp.]|uniref:antitoxin n=1 Tax=Glaesserella sp. TaxID=2094731 RepID=UPI0035A17B5C